MGALKWLSNRKTIARKTQLVRLQIEYLTNVLAVGRVYSVPPDDCGDGGDTQATSRHRFFSIVDMSPQNKRHMVSPIADTIVMPVSVQHLDIHPKCNPDTELIVIFKGDPCTVDLLEFAAWPVLRRNLVTWTASTTPKACGYALSHPQPVSPQDTWDGANTPTVVLLECLASSGWQVGKPPPDHVLGATKQFRATDPLSMKPYLRCLVGLSHLIDCGLVSLPSGQTALYYTAVVTSKEPASVPLDAQSSVYRALSAGDTAPPETLAVGATADDDGSEDGIVTVFGRSCKSEPLRKQRAGDGERALRHRAPPVSHSAASNWQQLFWPGGEGGHRTAALPPEPPAEGTSSSTLVTAQCEPPGAVAESPAQSAEPPSTQVKRRRIIVEGVDVFEEDRPFAYSRLLVTCPYHKGVGKDTCKKTRVFQQLR